MTINPRFSPGLLQFYCGSCLLLLFVLAAAIACAYPSEQVSAVNTAAKLLPPSSSYWLGTDYLGRSNLLLLVKGAQVSLITATAACAVSLLGGTLLGGFIIMAPAYLRYPLYYANTLLQIFPALLIAAMLVTIFKAGALTVILAIGLAGIPSFARLSMACSKSLLPKQFILAAKTAGLSNWRIFWQHLLPNMTKELLTLAGAEFIIAILAEAALSYLGFGIQPPAVSWGRMLSEAQNWLTQAPLLAIYPGLAIALLAMAILWINDGLNQYFSWRQKGKFNL